LIYSSLPPGRLFIFLPLFATSPATFILIVPEAGDTKNPPEETGGGVFNNNFRECEN
jgi:hypothetical protein